MQRPLIIFLLLALTPQLFGQAIQDSTVRQKYENTQDTPDHIAFAALLGHVSARSQSQGRDAAIHYVADMLSGGHVEHTSEELKRADRVYTLLIEAHANSEIDIQQSVGENVCTAGYLSRNNEQHAKAVDDHDDSQESVYLKHYANTISQLDTESAEAMLKKLDDLKNSLVYVKLDHAKHYANAGLDAGEVVRNWCEGR